LRARAKDRRREITSRTGGGGPEEGQQSGESEGGVDAGFEPGPEVLDNDAPLDLPLVSTAAGIVARPYVIYTTRHDQVARAEDVVANEALREARELLDKRRSGNKRAAGPSRLATATAAHGQADALMDVRPR
jgi:hypothetical protein